MQNLDDDIVNEIFKNKSKIPNFVFDPKARPLYCYINPIVAIVTAISLIMMPFTMGIGAKAVLKITRPYEMFFDVVCLLYIPVQFLTATYDDAGTISWTW